MTIDTLRVTAYAFMALTSALACCTRQTDGTDASLVRSRDRLAADSSANRNAVGGDEPEEAGSHEVVPRIDACAIARRVSQEVAEIMLHPSAIVSSSEDECVLSIID